MTGGGGWEGVKPQLPKLDLLLLQKKELQEVLKQSEQSWLLKCFQGLGFNRMSFSFPLIIYLKSQVELFMNKS